MQIRSITLGLDASAGAPTAACQRGGSFLRAARQAFEEAGFGVQTTRLCTQPASSFLPVSAFAPWARALDAACVEEGIDYSAVGGIILGDGWAPEPAAQAVVSAIGSTERVFSSIQLLRGRQIDFQAAWTAGQAITQIASQTPQGFGNLRFAASANCPPNVPFFPVAFHGGGPPRFSIAVQWADLVVQALGGEGPVEQAEERLVEGLQRCGSQLEAVARSLEAVSKWEYAGLDLSPAPFPSAEESVVGGIEALGVDRFGAPGSLAAASILTRALKRVPLQRCGFSGLMLPVLEDSVLAQRASEGLVSVSDLLLYSAVCGTGLDTVPLPGHTPSEEIASLLLDLAALALVLDKPLTARLFPVPGKGAGQFTEFSFPFFANARVLSLKGYSSSRLLARGMDVPLRGSQSDPRKWETDPTPEARGD